MTELAAPAAALALSLCALVSAAGCDSAPPPADAGRDAAPIDAPIGLPDGSRRCEVDEDCTDRFDCTLNRCDERGLCVAQLQHAMCDDLVYCNGVELCDPLAGCVNGARETCDDMDVCTIDRCDEEERRCVQTMRDLDEDGDVDFFCAGGGDCDDYDPTRSSRVSEICADRVDNDCDEAVDEAGCGRPTHDTCEDAIDVSAGGTFVLDTRGATPDYATGCASLSSDLVAHLRLDEPRDVRITAEGDLFTTAVSLRTTCDDRASERECRQGYPASVRARALPAGDYFVVVASLFGMGEIVLDVQLSPPSEAPPNETCAAPIDVSAGGSFPGSLVDARDDLPTTCGFGPASELVYVLTTTAEQDVRLNAASATGESMSIAVRSACEGGSADLRCLYGAPASGRLHQLPAGTYFLVVEGPGYVEVDFTLSVDILPPTPPADGDLCNDPIEITPGTTFMGTLVDREDDLTTTCGYYYRDVVHRFELADRSDVTITVDGGTSYLNASTRRTCTDSAGQLRCTAGAPTRQRLRDMEAGEYFVIVESGRGGAYSLDVDATPPTPAVMVAGNDICGTAHVVPETGGLFVGNTTGFLDDYQTSLCSGGARGPDVAFRLTLTATRRVLASTSGSAFDTVLHLHRDGCTSMGERDCNDNAIAGDRTSQLDLLLDAGTYYFVVDGWSAAATGDYAFEVIVSDP